MQKPQNKTPNRFLRVDDLTLNPLPRVRQANSARKGKNQLIAPPTSITSMQPMLTPHIEVNNYWINQKFDMRKLNTNSSSTKRFQQLQFSNFNDQNGYKRSITPSSKISKSQIKYQCGFREVPPEKDLKKDVLGRINEKLRAALKKKGRETILLISQREHLTTFRKEPKTETTKSKEEFIRSWINTNCNDKPVNKWIPKKKESHNNKSSIGIYEKNIEEDSDDHNTVIEYDCENDYSVLLNPLH